MKRAIVISIGYILFTTVVLESKLVVSEPKSIPVVAPTEAQIKEQVKREREERARAKAIARATAAARAVYRQNGCSTAYSDLTGRTAYELGLSSRLLAAVVFTESSCRATAVSGRDSIGLMQVNPRIWGHRSQLKDPAFNMLIGARILRGYIARYGLVEGLHHYNGLGDPSNDYAERVFVAGGIS